MARDTQMQDREILEAALSGYQSELSRVVEAMSAIRSRLGIRGSRLPVASTGGVQPAPTKRNMSAAARRRIAIAQKKRWAAARAEKAEAEKPTEKPKRKMSAAGKARIAAATKKRWAAFHKAQKAAAGKTTRKPKAKAPEAKTAVATGTAE